jgi:prepilin signal peptidase PulO-like enzyme (type II secretory pathway)
LEAIALVCLYGLASIEDIVTRQIQVIEIVMFSMLGIVINYIYRNQSLMSILGGVGVGVAVYIFSVISKEKIGRGDALMIMVTGLYLGFTNTLVLLWLSSLLAALIGAIVIRKYDSNMNYEMPFIPFLLVGYLVLLLVHYFGGIPL